MTRDSQDARYGGDARRIGALIIGDEILSGKRQDKHLAQLIGMLAGRGLRLTWARYVGDDHEQLVDALEQSFGAADLVFLVGEVVRDGVEHFDGGGGHFGADPVTGKEGDLRHKLRDPTDSE